MVIFNSWIDKAFVKTVVKALVKILNDGGIFFPFYTD